MKRHNVSLASNHKKQDVGTGRNMSSTPVVATASSSFEVNKFAIPDTLSEFREALSKITSKMNQPMGPKHRRRCMRLSGSNNSVSKSTTITTPTLISPTPIHASPIFPSAAAGATVATLNETSTKASESDEQPLELLYQAASLDASSLVLMNQIISNANSSSSTLPTGAKENASDDDGVRYFDDLFTHEQWLQCQTIFDHDFNAHRTKVRSILGLKWKHFRDATLLTQELNGGKNVDRIVEIWKLTSFSVMNRSEVLLSKRLSNCQNDIVASMAAYWNVEDATMDNLIVGYSRNCWGMFDFEPLWIMCELKFQVKSPNWWNKRAFKQVMATEHLYYDPERDCVFAKDSLVPFLERYLDHVQFDQCRRWISKVKSAALVSSSSSHPHSSPLLFNNQHGVQVQEWLQQQSRTSLSSLLYFSFDHIFELFSEFQTTPEDRFDVKWIRIRHKETRSK